MLNEKRLEIEEWLGLLPAQDDSSLEPDTTTEAASPFHYQLGKFVYQTPESLQYIDSSLQPPLQVKLSEIELIVESIDSNQPQQPSNIRYSANIGEHGNIKLEGTATPLAAKPSFDVGGNLAGIDLRQLSSFTVEAIGHSIDSGQLDADLKLVAEESVLNSEIDLKLHHFELTAKSPDDEENVNSSFGFPLNASLSLLKDRDNRIQLNIPVTGDLENPEFNPNDAIQQAVSTAITAAIINYYTPFGLVTLADGLFSLATALDFDPVVFDAGSAAITASSQEGLDKIATLMDERPGVHITLCPFTNTADRVSLIPDTAEIAADELELSDEQGKLLSDLGESRSSAVKQYLADRQIDAARLVLCNSKHVEGEGLSGTKISI